MNFKSIVKKYNKEAAIELSMTTIVVVVLALTLLIMGFVLVRSIMCTAISLTDDAGKGAANELKKLFGNSQDGVICIGEGGEGSTIVPNRLNVIWCGIKSGNAEQYTFDVQIDKENSEIITSGKVTYDAVRKWVVGSTKNTVDYSPSLDVMYSKVFRISPPKDAPEGGLVLKVLYTKKGSTSSTSKSLDFSVSRQGVLSTTLC